MYRHAFENLNAASEVLFIDFQWPVIIQRHCKLHEPNNCPFRASVAFHKFSLSSGILIAKPIKQQDVLFAQV